MSSTKQTWPPSRKSLVRRRSLPELLRFRRPTNRKTSRFLFRSTRRRPCNTFCLVPPVPDETRETLKSCSTPAGAQEVVADLEQTEAILGIRKWLDAIVAAGSVDSYIYDKILAARVPKFMYFDEYYQMRGCDNIDALKQRVAAETLEKSDHPMLGLIHKARLDLDSEPYRERRRANDVS